MNEQQQQQHISLCVCVYEAKRAKLRSQIESEINPNRIHVEVKTILLHLYHRKYRTEEQNAVCYAKKKRLRVRQVKGHVADDTTEIIFTWDASLFN